jgi:hypothetical protein
MGMPANTFQTDIMGLRCSNNKQISLSAHVVMRTLYSTAAVAGCSLSSIALQCGDLEQGHLLCCRAVQMTAAAAAAAVAVATPEWNAHVHDAVTTATSQQ